MQNQRQTFNRGNNGGNRYEQSQPSLPSGYLVDGYFGKSGGTTAKREFVLDYAQEIADALSNSRPELKKTQLRGFYNKLKYAWENTERDMSKLDDALLSVAQLASLAHQAVAKSNAPKLFQDFMDLNVKNVDSYDTLRAFEQHFKAIICYYPESKNKH